MKISELIHVLSSHLVEHGDLEVIHSQGDWDEPKPINHTSLRIGKENYKVCLKTYWE